ncbi:MAG: ribbon-helix-helix domain-containing protein [bacterium]
MKMMLMFGKDLNKYLNTFRYQLVSMGTQINLKLSDQIYSEAKKYSKTLGYGNIQEFIRETIREKLFEKENEKVSGFRTYLASEKSLLKLWNTKEEDEAWKNL